MIIDDGTVQPFRPFTFKRNISDFKKQVKNENEVISSSLIFFNVATSHVSSFFLLGSSDTDMLYIDGSRAVIV